MYYYYLLCIIIFYYIYILCSWAKWGSKEKRKKRKKEKKKGKKWVPLGFRVVKRVSHEVASEQDTKKKTKETWLVGKNKLAQVSTL